MLTANLVIQTAFLGDLILGVPLFKRIKFLFPNEKLIVMCKKGLGDFLLNEKIVDEIIEVEKGQGESYKQAYEKLTKYNLNCIYCVHRSTRSLLFCAKLKANKKIGFSSFLGFWVFDDLVQFETKYPEVLRQFKILETTDTETKKEFLNDKLLHLNNMLEPIPDFFSFPEVSKRKTHESLRIGIFPGSVWATKRWTKEGFSELVKMLVEKKYAVDLLGGPDEKGLCLEIANDTTGVEVKAGLDSVAGAIENIVNYDVIVANDSAPTHMAAYKNVPVVSIFGPTTSQMGFRPWREKAIVVENSEITCRPCGAHGHMQCPKTHFKCMRSISAMQVLSAIEKLV